MTKRLCRIAAGVLLALVFALPVQAADYETALDLLGRLQDAAEGYIASTGGNGDAFSLTLSYTRVGEYNSDIWQMVAGIRDPEFANYVASNAPETVDLQGMGTVTLPNGQNIDFDHLLAAMDLVHKGVPITGSWGGDCMELAEDYAGQAGDPDGYMSLMQATFNIDDNGTASRFGDQDLRADMDAIVLGSHLTEGVRLADLMREYYGALTDYDRARDFIALSFGDVDTGNQGAFRQKVYETLVGDTGMQLLLYMHEMWDASDAWCVQPEAEPALRAACYLLADYLAGAVNHEHISGSSDTLMQTVSNQALADALAALGDDAAAQAALGAGSTDTATAQPDGSRVDGVLDNATEHLRSGFNVKLFRAVLLVIGAAALIACIVFTVLFTLEVRKPPKRRRRRA